jgi:hypothetical protein
MVPQTREYYNKLSVDAGPINVAQWEKEISTAEQSCSVDESSMDIMATRLDKIQGPVPSSHAIETESSSWVALGLKIEEKQYVTIFTGFFHLTFNDRWNVRDEVRRGRKNLSDSEQMAIQAKRHEITALIHKYWQRRNATTFQHSNSNGNIPSQRHINPCRVPVPDDEDNFSDIEDDEFDDEGFIEIEENAEILIPVEEEVVPLPSSEENASAVDWDLELRLRCERAEVLLAQIRECIAERSFQYTKIIRHAPRKSVKTRARSRVIEQAAFANDLARQYNRCRAVMLHLGLSERKKLRYQHITKKDLNVSTALVDPNIPGSTTINVGWIWQVGLDSADTPAAVTECKLPFLFFSMICPQSSSYSQKSTLATCTGTTPSMARGENIARI